MKTLKIYYHDGSVQVVTPQQDPTKENNFKGDWKGLAETIAGFHKKAYRPYYKIDIV